MSASSSASVRSTASTLSQGGCSSEVDQGRSIDRAFLVAQVLRQRHADAEPVVVADRYELLRKIGAGGYGTVYEAEDRKMRRRVALKVLELGDSDAATREGQLLAKLDHANVVTIFDHGVGPDYRYLAMQLLEGPGLRRACAGMSPVRTIAKYVEAGRGLAAIHAGGLVHRDFKPSNVRIGPLGQAVVVDFGLARHLDTLDADPAEVGVFVGTIDYAPPERLLGYPGDHRSDQFSFCVALWEALSGVNPWPCTASTTAEARFRSFGADMVGAPRGGWWVEETLRRGLSLEPANRYPDMAELLAGLAPRRPRWAWRELAIGAVSALCIAAVMTQLMPSPAGGASSEFVANAHAKWVGQVAMVAARQGNVDGALLQLESAKRVAQSDESSRHLGEASEAVAQEFERQLNYADALMAWQLAILFARDLGDTETEERARRRLRAATRAATSAQR